MSSDLDDAETQTPHQRDHRRPRLRLRSPQHAPERRDEDKEEHRPDLADIREEDVRRAVLTDRLRDRRDRLVRLGLRRREDRREGERDKKEAGQSAEPLATAFRSSDLSFLERLEDVSPRCCRRVPPLDHGRPKRRPDYNVRDPRLERLHQSPRRSKPGLRGPEYGAFVEPSGGNQWQSAANRRTVKAARQTKSVAMLCHQLR